MCGLDLSKQHFLNLFPLPHGQRSSRDLTSAKKRVLSAAARAKIRAQAKKATG